MKVARLLVVVSAICALCTGVAFATEGGGGMYPNGVEGLMTGAVPPPGDYAINYLLYYGADTWKGIDGADNMLTTPDGTLPVDFKLTVWANTFRYIHVTDKKILGGFWAQHVFVPIVYQDVKIVNTGSVGPRVLAEDDRFGLGDIIVDPFIVAWHGENWHAAAGVDIYVPIGTYDADDAASPGRNYWTFEPVVAGTLLLPGEVEVSVKAMYDINTENGDTDYESGDEFHFDYAVAKKLGKEWCVGVSGFYYDQVTEDKIAGADIGNEGQQIAVGPVVSYQSGKQTFVLKWLTETETENKPEGDRFILKFITPL